MAARNSAGQWVIFRAGRHCVRYRYTINLPTVEGQLVLDSPVYVAPAGNRVRGIAQRATGLPGVLGKSDCAVDGGTVICRKLC
jgi:hypothetical protein